MRHETTATLRLDDFGINCRLEHVEKFEQRWSPSPNTIVYRGDVGGWSATPTTDGADVGVYLGDDVVLVLSKAGK